MWAIVPGAPAGEPLSPENKPARGTVQSDVRYLYTIYFIGNRLTLHIPIKSYPQFYSPDLFLTRMFLYI